MKSYKKIEMTFRQMKKGYLMENGLGLNLTAFEIWDFCSTQKTDAEIVNLLVEKYSPETEDEKVLIENDVNMCIKNLIEGELISEV